MQIEVIPSEAEEIIDGSLQPQLLVQELALLKAAWVAKSQPKGRLVIGADTVVAIDGDILGKPLDGEDAKAMLQRYFGADHQYYDYRHAKMYPEPDFWGKLSLLLGDIKLFIQKLWPKKNGL